MNKLIKINLQGGMPGYAGAGALMFSVINGCSWDYMNNRQNQYMPFRFEGTGDDTIVYNLFRKVTSNGYQIHEK